MLWLIMAALSAFFAGLTAILAKCGIRNTDSDLATAIRTVVILIFSWVMVFIVGSASSISQIEPKSALFLILSGITTGGAWICYFKALSMADVSKVVPVDKFGTVLTVILAVVLFRETSHFPAKIVGVILISAGIYLMIEKKDMRPRKKKGWFVYALLAAVFTSLTAVLAKAGISDVESNLGTAIRTGVVLVLAWLVVFGKRKQKLMKTVDKKELLFICLSGLATGASWVCYYYAIQKGHVSVVGPIEKLNILFSIAFSRIALKEKLKKRAVVGLALMTAGTVTMAIWP